MNLETEEMAERDIAMTETAGVGERGERKRERKRERGKERKRPLVGIVFKVVDL